MICSLQIKTFLDSYYQTRMPLLIPSIGAKQPS